MRLAGALVQAAGPRGADGWPTHADARGLMARFEEHYDDLVDVLCGAARDGSTHRMETRYATLRAAVSDGYDEVRPLLAAHRSGRSSTTDPFEALVAPPSLAAAIAHAGALDALAESRAILETWHQHWDTT